MSIYNLMLVGASGRMGQEILCQVMGQKKLIPHVAICRSSVENFHQHARNFKSVNADEVDIVIDFSTPALFTQALAWSVKNQKAFVSGTTGLSSAQKKSLQKAAQKIPVLWSPNMSLGVAMLKQALSVFAAAKDFDFQIIEFHHNKKKDNPGGTALWLHEDLLKKTKKKIPTPYGVRGGGIFGIHQVHAMAESETLVFEHTALNRSVFAKGAIQAAEWLLEKPPGLYSMPDLFA